MKLLISHYTALRYWRLSNPYVPYVETDSAHVRTMRDAIGSIREIHKIGLTSLGFCMDEEHPLDILVGKSSNRCAGPKVRAHLWTARLPRNAFFVVKGVYVSSPEFVFLQLATSLSLVQLSQLANELCGTYSLAPGKVDMGRVPLTSRLRLQHFLEQAGSVRGAKKALQALRWVADGSASPQETNLMLALCLPRKLGGYALPLPELNREIEVGQRMERFVDGTRYRPDLMWVRMVGGKRVRVTVEYDSHEYHDVERDAERTRIRRNNFKALGYLVTSVNKSQMRDATAFQVAALQVARDLGVYRAEHDMRGLSALDQLLHDLRDGEVH